METPLFFLVEILHGLILINDVVDDFFFLLPLAMEIQQAIKNAQWSSSTDSFANNSNIYVSCSLSLVIPKQKKKKNMHT